MGSSKTARFISFSVLAASLVGLGLFFSCGSGSTSTSIGGSNGTVNTTLSDPMGGCAISADHVYVTVTKVTANVSSDASSTDGNWQPLVDLTGAPKQIDLASLATGTCALSQLGSASLPAGTYHQIRLYLLANNATLAPANNACSTVGGFNCVQPTGGTLQPLLLSSEAQTGIKIPSSQITQGGLTVSAGDTVDLNIDMNAGCSLVHQGNGQWRLKPVLHAGQVQTNNSGLSGTVVDSASNSPIGGATVSLEQPVNGIDVVFDSTTTDDVTGNFSFCGNALPTDAVFDVVVTKWDTSNPTPVTYNATVTLNAAVGNALGTIPLIAEPAQIDTNSTISSPAQILGQVSTTDPQNAATSAAITISALQDVGGGKIVTIPPFDGSSPTNFVTAAAPTFSNGKSASTCTTTGTDCENYLLILPASNPSVGTFTAGQTTMYSTPTANPALYWVQATSTMPNDPTTTDCSPSSFPDSLTGGVSPMGTQIAVDPPPLTDNVVTQDFAFPACTAGQ